MTVNHKEYALALFQLSVEEKCMEQCFGELSHICDALKENPEYLKLLSTNLLSENEKFELVEKAFSGCCDILLKFIKLLISKKIISSLPCCAKEYNSLYCKEKGIITATVISAVPLSSEQKKALEQKLCTQRGKKDAIVKYETDPKLLGGALIRVDGEEIDYTIKRKLNDLKGRLIEK